MKFVYMINSISNPDRYYTGSTTDIDRRMKEHNAGQSIHTNKFMPWRMVTYIAFSDYQRADEFEAYLKTASGRTFAKRHF